MRDILLIVGLSGSGKDYLSKQLVKNHGFNNMVSYTTRPMRDGEQDGVEYHFIQSNEEFDKLVDSGEIFEQTEYHTKHGLWKYGYGRKSIPEVGKFKNVAIVNPHGVEQFLHSEISDRICVIDVHATDSMRLQKICERYGGLSEMTDIQMCEAFRREVEDAKPFNEYFRLEGKWSGYYNEFFYNTQCSSTWRHTYDGDISDVLSDINWMMRGEGE